MAIRAEVLKNTGTLSPHVLLGLTVMGLIAAWQLSMALHDWWNAANDNTPQTLADRDDYRDEKGSCDLSPTGEHEPGKPFVDFTLIGKVTLARCEHCNGLLFSMFS